MLMFPLVFCALLLQLTAECLTPKGRCQMSAHDTQNDALLVPGMWETTLLLVLGGRVGERGGSCCGGDQHDNKLS